MHHLWGRKEEGRGGERRRGEERREERGRRGNGVHRTHTHAHLHTLTCSSEYGVQLFLLLLGRRFFCFTHLPLLQSHSLLTPGGERGREREG